MDREVVGKKMHPKLFHMQHHIVLKQAQKDRKLKVYIVGNILKKYTSDYFPDDEHSTLKLWLKTTLRTCDMVKLRTDL